MAEVPRVRRDRLDDSPAMGRRGSARMVRDERGAISVQGLRGKWVAAAPARAPGAPLMPAGGRG